MLYAHRWGMGFQIQSPDRKSVREGQRKRVQYANLCCWQDHISAGEWSTDTAPGGWMETCVRSDIHLSSQGTFLVLSLQVLSPADHAGLPQSIHRPRCFPQDLVEMCHWRGIWVPIRGCGSLLFPMHPCMLCILSLESGAWVVCSCNMHSSQSTCSWDIPRDQRSCQSKAFMWFGEPNSNSTYYDI